MTDQRTTFLLQAARAALPVASGKLDRIEFAWEIVIRNPDIARRLAEQDAGLWYSIQLRPLIETMPWFDRSEVEAPL